MTKNFGTILRCSGAIQDAVKRTPQHYYCLHYMCQWYFYKEQSQCLAGFGHNYKLFRSDRNDIYLSKIHSKERQRANAVELNAAETTSRTHWDLVAWIR
mmetsp:Transcript_26081/g.52241  ORF Transcript_26081/g.52241 Transcript_26081/m.52241 type:complete len:99 (-) Transcript_26081:16-312(-)